MKVNKEQALGIARHVLTFAGGIAVSKGLVDESTMITIVGAFVTLAGGLWSVFAPEKQA